MRTALLRAALVLPFLPVFLVPASAEDAPAKGIKAAEVRSLG